MPIIITPSNNNPTEVLVVEMILLDPPAFMLMSIDTKIKDTQYDVVTPEKKVIINGILQVQIDYKTKKREHEFDYDKCVYGDLNHCTVDFPFFVLMPLQFEASPDLIVEITIEKVFSKLQAQTPESTYRKVLFEVVLKVLVKLPDC